MSAPYVERFGARGRYSASIIVCLYGRPEYLFLQAAMFSAQAGIGAYEFIYVVNSFWIAEAVLKEARRAAQIYGLDITVVVLAGNAGFGAANNVGAECRERPVADRQPRCVSTRSRLGGRA